MAVRPFAFGIRLREGSRTVRVRGRHATCYVVEDSRRQGETRRREHGSLAAALRDAASIWRSRLH